MAIKNLTLKIQGQGHGWGQSFKSQLGSNILSDSVRNSHRSASLRLKTLEEDWEIFVDFPSIMFMIWDSSHEDLQPFDWVSNTASYGFISLYVNPLSYSYDKSFFEIWPSKSKVKVIAQGHIIGITSYRLISLSFHVDQPSHSWDAAI